MIIILVNPLFSYFKKKNLVSTLILLSLLFLASVFIPAVKNPLINILKYPLSIFTVVGRELGGIIFFHKNLVQNELLINEIGLLKNMLNKTEEVYLENQRLSKLLFLKQESSYRTVAARVLGRDPSNWSSSVMVNKGSSSGIKKGFVCLSQLGLVGKVVETTSSVSKVMLLNDPNLGVSALIQRSRQEGLISGSLGGFLMMKYMPKDCDVKVSDEVITSGLTANYPKGLLIGSVVDIGEEFSGLSRYAVVKPAVNLSGIEEVLIIVQ